MSIDDTRQLIAVRPNSAPDRRARLARDLKRLHRTLRDANDARLTFDALGGVADLLGWLGRIDVFIKGSNRGIPPGHS